MSLITQTPLSLSKGTPIHFIGAGGVGMSALALVLQKHGFTVSGSDAQDSLYLQKLQTAGATTYIGHQANQVPDNAQIILSTAISQENPEVAEARKKGLSCFHRSDILREILKQFDCAIGLAGTHGKTTMTGMAGLVLEAAGLDPTVIAGGKVPQFQSNAKIGNDTKYVIAELDESDGSIIQYQPGYTVISNLEWDHPEHYPNGLESVKAIFTQFLSALGAENAVIFNIDCPVTQTLYSEFRHHVNALAVAPMADEPISETYTLQNVILHLEGGYQADVYFGHDCIGSLWLQVPGKHNLYNALNVAVIGHQLGIPFETIRRALENFTGMGRRFEILGHYNGALIVDDYAHHPTEVKVTLRAAQEKNRGKGRVIALFQPHRPSRLQALWDDFIEAFEDADEVVIFDIYSAGEPSIEGISSERFAHALPHASCEYWPSSDWSLVEARLKTIVTPGDLVLTIGAGSITQLGRQLMAGNTP